MKKILILFIISSFVFTGCMSKKNTNDFLLKHKSEKNIQYLDETLNISGNLDSFIVINDEYHISVKNEKDLVKFKISDSFPVVYNETVLPIKEIDLLNKKVVVYWNEEVGLDDLNNSDTKSRVRSIYILED